MTTTFNGVADSDDTVNDAAEALLGKFMPDGDPDEPKKKVLSEDNDEQNEKAKPGAEESEETSDESPEETEETEDQEDPKQPKKVYVDDDDAFAKVKLGDEEHEVPVKDLKRLWGQEKSLTQKSQEVADLRKSTDAEKVKVVESYNKLLQRAQERFAPYAKIDFGIALKELSTEDYTALRAEAQARLDDVRFLSEELDGHVKQINEASKAESVKNAQSCVKALCDPENASYIEGWGDKVYGELREFAVQTGLSRDLFNQLTDPAAIKLIHMAQLFAKGSSKVQKLTTKVDKQPKKIIKSSKSPATIKPDQAKADKAFARLAKTGTTDDAAEALYARWKDRASDD